MNTIVFVEDDAEVGSLIAAYLAKHDMQVTVEPRGDQAEETILRENPDLVLSTSCYQARTALPFVVIYAQSGLDRLFF